MNFPLTLKPPIQQFSSYVPYFEWPFPCQYCSTFSPASCIWTKINFDILPISELCPKPPIVPAVFDVVHFELRAVLQISSQEPENKMKLF
jgi:hypothetical protein